MAITGLFVWRPERLASQPAVQRQKGLSISVLGDGKGNQRRWHWRSPGVCVFDVNRGRLMISQATGWDDSRVEIWQSNGIHREEIRVAVGDRLGRHANLVNPTRNGIGREDRLKLSGRIWHDTLRHVIRAIG